MVASEGLFSALESFLCGYRFAVPVHGESCSGCRSTGHRTWFPPWWKEAGALQQDAAYGSYSTAASFSSSRSLAHTHCTPGPKCATAVLLAKEQHGPLGKEL